MEEVPGEAAMEEKTKISCPVCCHHCQLAEGQSGACGARKNSGGQIIASNYGRLTSLALDPIEKKPLALFHPGTRILSVGSYGCSLRCPFCQNFEIASAREKIFPFSGDGPEKVQGGPEKVRRDPEKEQGDPEKEQRDPEKVRRDSEKVQRGDSPDTAKSGSEQKDSPVFYSSAAGTGQRELETVRYTPQELCDLGLGLRSRGNIGIAFTYNEPLVGYEFVRDTARLFHERGMKTVLVTNGMASQEVLMEILPFTDAMNIDLKGFTTEFYRDFVGGDLEMVKDFISCAVQDCHVELTKLIIPGKNDGEEEMREMAAWIASLKGGRGRDIPLHVSRYFPRYRWTEPATRVETVYGLADVARAYLDHVFTGNC